MKEEGSLFSLVASLTQHEKRYLVLHLTHLAQGRESQVLRLYKRLEQNPGADEQALKAMLGDDPLSRQWAVYKHLCYQALLRGLQAYRYEHSPAMRVRSGLDKVEILMERGHHAAALKLLLRTRSIAEEYSHNGCLMELLDWERRILRQTNPVAYVDELPRIEAYERKLMAILAQEAEVMRLYDRLYAWVQVERRMEKAGLAAPLAEVGQRLEQLSGVAVPIFSTKVTLLHAQALCKQMQGDYEGMLAAYRAALQLWEAHPHIKETAPERHARAQGAWLNALLAAGQIGKHLPDIRRLRRIPIQGHADRARTVFQSYNLELLWLMDQRHAEDALHFLQELEEKLPPLQPHLDTLRLGSLCLNAMIIAFRDRQHDLVLRWLRRMPETVRQERANVVFRSAEVLGMVSASQLGEWELAESRLAALARRIRGTDADWEFGRLLVKWMRKLLPRFGTQDEKHIRNEFQAALTQLSQKSQPVPLIMDLILAWVTDH